MSGEKEVQVDLARGQRWIFRTDSGRLVAFTFFGEKDGDLFFVVEGWNADRIFVTPEDFAAAHAKGNVWREAQT